MQFIFSYLGMLPYIFIIIDINFNHIISVNILKEFLIFYTLLIITFVGAMRWSFSLSKPISYIVYGFIPSLISFILIIVNLLFDNQNLIFLLIFFTLMGQLIGDFIFSKINTEENFFYKTTRLPITFVIAFINFYFIFV